MAQGPLKVGVTQCNILLLWSHDRVKQVQSLMHGTHKAWPGPPATCAVEAVLGGARNRASGQGFQGSRRPTAALICNGTMPVNGIYHVICFVTFNGS